MTSEEIKNKIRTTAVEGKIACAAAFRLAEELGISRQELGSLLDDMKIKIAQCQLGCF